LCDHAVEADGARAEAGDAGLPERPAVALSAIVRPADVEAEEASPEATTEMQAMGSSPMIPMRKPPGSAA
jgi:hypothetical protein